MCVCVCMYIRVYTNVHIYIKENNRVYVSTYPLLSKVRRILLFLFEVRQFTSAK